MLLDVAVELDYSVAARTDFILQIEVADLADQVVVAQDLELNRMESATAIAGEDGMGRRWLLTTDSVLRCRYAARVEVDRPALDISRLPATPVRDLPGDTIRYLMPSRYCPSDQMQEEVAAEFGDFAGGQRIAAIRDWMFETYAYEPGSSVPTTTALDTWAARKGVCRDFAHVMIALARASGIPARFASVYGPCVDPPDFHAVAEVFLDGTWHLVDPTGMAAANEMARIGVGADAAEVPFLASFGPMEMLAQTVSVVEAPGSGVSASGTKALR